MELSVLGPLVARLGNRSFVPSAPQPRKVLALLLVNAGKPVSVGDLERELWGDQVPPSHRTALQTYMLNLRKKIAVVTGWPAARVAAEMLVTTPAGYAFELGGAELDLHRFARLTAEGNAAISAGEVARGSEALHRALSLWRGAPLSDIDPGPVLWLETHRLELARAAALERRIEADLRLGRDYELLAELAALTTADCLNENLHAQYMITLYRTGRRAQALNVFQQLRLTLRDELGLEPSPRLHKVQQAVIAADPVLDAPQVVRLLHPATRTQSGSAA
jgi:SARP family transcriptional regulator, regulator of embCAB operon